MTYKPTVVLYHANCKDGFGAAWSVWKALEDESIQFIPVEYNKEPPKVEGETVLIVDFSYDAQTLKAMAAVAESIVVLDHHKTAREALSGFYQAPDMDADDVEFHLSQAEDRVVVQFDMKQSGAALAYRFFFRCGPPPLITYIMDRDLWLWDEQCSKEVNAYISTFKHDFKAWTRLEREIRREFVEVVAKGRTVLSYIDTVVEDIAEQATESVFHGHKVVTFLCNKRFVSETGNALLEQYPDADFVIGYSDRADGQREFSLRSRPGFDASEIARIYGGGGHPQACGFVAPSKLGLPSLR